jgi:hypothetical protein
MARVSKDGLMAKLAVDNCGQKVIIRYNEKNNATANYVVTNWEREAP